MLNAKISLLLLFAAFLLNSCVTITKTIQGVDMNQQGISNAYEFSEWQVYESTASRVFIFGNLSFKRKMGFIQLPQGSNLWQIRGDSTNISISQTPLGFVPPPTSTFIMTLTQRAYYQAVFEMITQNPDMEVVGQPIFEIQTVNGFIFFNQSKVKIRVRLGKRR